MSTPTPKRGRPAAKPTDVPQNDSNMQAQETPNISKDKLDSILATVERLARENEALKKSVDQQVYQTHLLGDKTDKRLLVRLMVVNNKPLKGWSNLHTNSVYFNNLTGQFTEDQTVTVQYIDGTEQKMKYTTAFNHNNRTDYLPVNGVSVRRTPEGTEERIFLVEYQGKEYEISEKFIN